MLKARAGRYTTGLLRTQTCQIPAPRLARCPEWLQLPGDCSRKSLNQHLIQGIKAREFLSHKQQAGHW